MQGYCVINMAFNEGNGELWVKSSEKLNTTYMENEVREFKAKKVQRSLSRNKLSSSEDH